MYKKLGKRFIDIMLSCIALVLLLPVFFMLILLLLISFKGNPFFLQARPGLNGKLFHLIKFRTMNKLRCEQGELLPDEHRLTSVGIFLRKTSLDEIPQLLNVLAGNMSLVGPRPLLPEYLPLYNQRQIRRHNVKPGITGWAQVNGRNALTWEEKFSFDLWYVDNISLKVDLKILYITLKQILIANYSTINGITSVQKFQGSSEIK